MSDGESTEWGKTFSTIGFIKYLVLQLRYSGSRIELFFNSLLEECKRLFYFQNQYSIWQGWVAKQILIVQICLHKRVSCFIIKIFNSFFLVYARIGSGNVPKINAWALVLFMEMVIITPLMTKGSASMETVNTH